MRALSWRHSLAGLLWIGISALSGCGQNQDSGGASADRGAGSGLPTASISSPAAIPNPDDDEGDDADADDPNETQVELQVGTPEWLVREATRLRLEAPPETDDVDELKRHRRERNETIITHCQKAIAAVHADSKQERLFNLAVRTMLEARLQLALTGDTESIDTLYEDAGALFQRDAQSAAAAEGAHALVNLAYSRAQSGGSDQRQWLGEFARQAMHFAGSFPAEERRSLPLVFTAARSCELAGLSPEAIDCYALIQSKFPRSQYAARVTAILRRLKLPGNPPQLSGPALDGDPVVLDDLLGQPVLVVFWASEAKPFRQMLPQLQRVIRRHAPHGLRVVGVNLDTDPAAVNQFVIEHKLPWPQIFFPEPEKRGWNNPVAGYYGIMDLPALWLIDPSGNVVSTSLAIEALGDEIAKLLPQAEPATAPSQSDESAAPSTEQPQLADEGATDDKRPKSGKKSRR
ncbi:MAG: TlpA family protein disulfide reductase [Planctomycetales bacterium]